MWDIKGITKFLPITETPICLHLNIESRSVNQERYWLYCNTINSRAATCFTTNNVSVAPLPLIISIKN